MIDSKEERSLGELFSDLARESSTLLRQEVQLAKTELSQKAVALGRDAASVAVGGLFAYAGLLAILAALKREDLAPRRTIESLQEDARWAKEQVR